MGSSIAEPPAARHRELPEKADGMARADLRKAEMVHREAIGRAIVRARGLLGWSLDRLAREVQRDPRQVSRWERGDERDRVQIDALWAVREFRGPWLLALGAEADDSGIVPTMGLDVRIRKAG